MRRNGQSSPCERFWLEWAARVLPFRDADELLCRLATLWRESTGAESAYVSLTLAGELLGRISSSDSPRLPQVRQPAESEWTPHNAVTALPQPLETRLSAVEIIPFDSNLPSAAGGAILWNRRRFHVPPDVSQSLAEWSTLCVRQARASHVGDSPDRNELRDAKLEAMAEFAAGAGHEINNPLATINGRVQLLLAKESDPERRRALTTIGGQVYRIRDMIGDAMLFARPPQPKPQCVALAAAISEAFAPLQSLIDEQQCSVVVDVDESLRLWADPVQLTIVISSLIRNSLEAMEVPGAIRISAGVETNLGGRKIAFSITDNGRGLSPADRLHLFDPFYSGRQAGRGLGFGLSKCWRIVTNHGGKIEVAADDGAGVTIRIIWPSEPPADG